MLQLVENIFFLLAYNLLWTSAVPVSISCIETATNPPSSVFTVRCPPNCRTYQTIWGSGFYTASSQICAAAIHDGKITNQGGIVTVEMGGSHSYYLGSTKNGITSNTYPRFYSSSFSFTGQGVTCSTKGTSLTGTTTNVICPANCASVTDHLWGTSVYTRDSYICAAAIHDRKITNAGGAVTVYHINGFNSYTASRQNGILSKSYGYWESAMTFEELCDKTGSSVVTSPFTMRCPNNCKNRGSSIWGTTIYTDNSVICKSAIHDGKIDANGGTFQMYNLQGMTSYRGTTQNDVTSESHGPSGGSFTFENLCLRKVGSLSSDSTMICPAGCASYSDKLHGSHIYTDTSYICAAAIHDGQISDAVGGTVTVHQFQGQCYYLSAIRNDLESETHGPTDASFAFSDLAACLQTGTSQTSNTFTINCPVGCQYVSCQLWGTGTYEANSFICAAAIHSGEISNEGGAVTGYKTAGRDSYDGSTQHGLTSKSYGNSQSSFYFQNLCLKRADSESTSTFSVDCPAGCGNTVGRLWGTRIYTSDSYVCAAAIHSGMITNAGGQVNVHKQPGRLSYEGSVQNGLTSQSYGPWSSSFVLKDLCTKRGDSESGPSFEVNCPTGCSLVTDRLWGTGVFSADSYVCAAAIHDGTINDEGGRVTVYIVDGRSSYTGSTQNGVTSRGFSEWASSFVLTDPANCKETAEDIEIESTITCPRGCQHFSRVWGTGIYTDDSYVCAAAIHDGRLTESGGVVTFYIKPGEQSYEGSQQNGILSRNYGAWERSFGFEDFCSKKADDFTDPVFTIECSFQCRNSPHNVWGSKVYTSHSSICAAAIHGGFVSGTGGGITVYKSGSRNNFIGSTRNGITSLSFGYYRTTFEFTDSCKIKADSTTLSQFDVDCRPGCQNVASHLWGSTLYTDNSFVCAAAIHYGTITDSGGKVTVYKSAGMSSYRASYKNGLSSKAHGPWTGSIGFENLCHKTALQVFTNELRITCPPGCMKSSAPLYGTNFYSGDSSICKAAIHDGAITASGGDVLVRIEAGMENYEGSTRHGVTSNNKALFPKTFILGDHCKKTGASIHRASSTFFCPPRCNENAHSVWGTIYYSSDSNICAAAIHSGVITAVSGGKVTVFTTIGLDSYEGSYKNRINSKSKTSWRQSFTFENICHKTGSLITTHGKHIIPCPSGCGNTGVVIGTDVYKQSSQICAAAIHDGRISNSGGLVVVYKASFMTGFQSSTQHGIISSSSNARSKTILFSDTCKKTGDGTPATTFSIMCIPGCIREGIKLWGTGNYTDDSNICVAAIHDGKITNSIGGLVEVQKGPGMSSYPGSTQNGVESFTFEKWHRSMTFI